jgi:pentatricopeptide repeat protein
MAEQRAMIVFDTILEAGLQPDAITFTSLLSAVSRSRDVETAKRADIIFQQMCESGIRPDVTAYTILLSIWSKSQVRGKEDRVIEICDR